MTKVTRTISCFVKMEDQPLWTRPLVGAPLGELRKLFHVPANDPMYASYPVTDDKVANKLSKWIGLGKSMDLDRYDYFLECEAVGVTPPVKRTKIKSARVMTRAR